MSQLILKGPIAKRLEEEARRHDMTPEEYLLELLTKDLDPQEKAKEYIKASKELLEEAKEELRKGNIRQAAEKVWGSAALAVKAYAYWKEGKRLSSHGELWEYKRKMEKEMGDWVGDAWGRATEMHVCFYEGWCNEEDVKKAIERVERLVNEVSRVIGH